LSPLYLLDTNTISYILSGHSKAARQKLELNLSESAISAVTEAELRFGLAKKPHAIKLRKAVEGLLDTIGVLPWDSEAARAYGTMRAKMNASGKVLSAMDMMIAAHAASLHAVLVTTDGTFRHAEGLQTIENWATDFKS
jgi:tRNA(fMet)-specific endonuclease VapC